MTRHDWLLALAAALTIGLLPGCLHVPWSSRQPVEAPPPAPQAVQPPTIVAAEETAPPRMPSYPLVPTRPAVAAPDSLASAANADFPDPPQMPPEALCGPVPDPTRADQAAQYPSDANWSTLSQSMEMGHPSPASPLGIGGGQVTPIYLPPDADVPVVGALRCLLEKRPDDAVSRLQGLDKANQEVLLCLLPLAARLGQGALDRASAGELAVMVDQAESVAAPLRRRAPLAIEKMSFCRRIDKFGQYEPLPDNHDFRPGELVQVYAELRNFTCQTGKCGYETRLGSSVRLTHHVGDREEIVWRQDFHDRDRVDCSRSPRRDYFNNYRFCIPDNLPAGRYKLWLKVVDVPTGRSAESSQPLAVTDRSSR